MSKEPAKHSYDTRDERNDQVPAKKDDLKAVPTDEVKDDDKYHGYTPEQIARMKAEVNPPQPPPPEQSPQQQPPPEPQPQTQPLPKKDDDNDGDDDDDDKKGKKR